MGLEIKFMRVIPLITAPLNVRRENSLHNIDFGLSEFPDLPRLAKGQIRLLNKPIGVPGSIEVSF